MQSVTKIGIIQFPGSNTERETSYTRRRASLEPVPYGTIILQNYLKCLGLLS